MNKTGSQDFPAPLHAPDGYVWKISKTPIVKAESELDVKFVMLIGIVPAGW